MIINTLSKGAMFILKNSRILRYSGQFALIGYKHYRANFYNTKLEELKKEYKRTKDTEIKKEGRNMLDRINEIILSQSDITESEKKELLKILRKNTHWLKN